ncbi:uncharacterized protein LOC115632932 [Scaptodrosophila lebanonensis]|uniref:Uncharacterized protein LOC115632932 n=1 Tax=Drosophila lebanonensis TaxID=7225 RepID=A0A6J2UD67_DROLE|nr:uncharacterized protein LOC115632932 [Scaptodrosophila lebanonensis]
MSGSEDNEIDRALIICQSVESSLVACLRTVQRLNEKYNAPDRYKIDMKPFDTDLSFAATDNASLFSESTSISLSSISNLTVDTSSLATSTSASIDEICPKVVGRTTRELDDSYVYLKWKCIKVRRDMEAALAHAQRLAARSSRQKRLKHTMLHNAWCTFKITCVH